MKYALTLLLVIINMICFGKVDTCGINFAGLVEKQIQTAIDSVSIHRGKSPYDFDVFVLRFYHLDKNKSDSCFTLGYIENSYEFALVHSDYFTEYKGYFVLFRFSDSDYARGLNALNIKKISRMDEVHIVQRLFPKDAGFMTYDPFGLTTNIKNRIITNSYYENAGEIPEEESIYDLYPSGTIRKIDTADFIHNIQTRPRKKINQ